MNKRQGLGCNVSLYRLELINPSMGVRLSPGMVKLKINLDDYVVNG
jgi:hypothetical protein